MNKQSGFTMIELIVVIVLLGILAATAIPKYYDMTMQARIASLNGLAGAVNSASAIAHGGALAAGQTGTTGTISMEGVSVGLAYGYPSPTGIIAAVTVTNQFTTASTATTATFTLQTNCLVTYTAATSATVPATVTTTTSGC